MARRKRPPHLTPTISRTLERVAIAALAAIASRATADTVAQAAIVIFLVVAVGEELGRGIVIRGKRVTLREMAIQRIATLGIWRPDNSGSRRKSKRKSRSRRKRDKKPPAKKHTSRS